MDRFALILCLMSRVDSAMTVTRHIYSHPMARQYRSNFPTSHSGYVHIPFDKSAGISSMFAHTEHNPYKVSEPEDIKIAEKLGTDSPVYTDPEMVTEEKMPYTFTPLTKFTRPEYEISRMTPRTKYMSNVKSNIMIDNMKSLVHHGPRGQVINDALYGYDSNNYFQSDDEDIRTSGKTLYDNNYGPIFYHNPYEYEHSKDADASKAKDKRFIAISQGAAPVYEQIDNDIVTPTPRYVNEPSSHMDDPIGGHGPFFSFVLNDYFDKNHEEDTLTFKGLGVDWGKEFDHETYGPTFDEMQRRDRQSENNYYTPVTPLLPNTLPTNSMLQDYQTTPVYTTSLENYMPEEVDNSIHESDEHETGKKMNTNNHKSYATGENKNEGFRNIVDSFVNKFGAEDHKKDSNYNNQINNDKGEKKKGFHRVYRKDEFLEDKEFYDNSHNGAKAAEKGSSNIHIGGSEALLHSQALAAAKNAANASRMFGNSDEENDVSGRSGYGRSNRRNNIFNEYIDVARQAAESNIVDYEDHAKD